MPLRVIKADNLDPGRGCHAAAPYFMAAAGRRFQKAMGNDAYAVEYASVGEIADAVVDLIVGAKQ